MTTAWTSLMSKNWRCPWLRTDLDAAEAGREIDLKCYGGRAAWNAMEADRRNTELCDAIRALEAKDDQNDCPTLRQLIRAVWAARNERERPAYAGGGLAGCEACRGGWLDIELDDWPGHMAAAPCTCAAGDHIVTACVPYVRYTPDQKAALEKFRRICFGAVKMGLKVGAGA